MVWARLGWQGTCETYRSSSRYHRPRCPRGTCYRYLRGTSCDISSYRHIGSLDFSPARQHNGIRCRKTRGLRILYRAQNLASYVLFSDSSIDGVSTPSALRLMGRTLLGIGSASELM